MKKKNLLMTILLLSIFSGCTATKTIYVYKKCPKLQVIDTNITIPKPVKLEIIK